MKRAAAVACLVAAASAAPFTQTKDPPRNKELEALHAHFEKVVSERHGRTMGASQTGDQCCASPDALGGHALAGCATTRYGDASRTASHLHD
jgi:hypothetical protein